MREKNKNKKTDDWLDNIKYPNSSKIIIFHDLLLISIFSFIVIFVPIEVRVELELQRDKSEFALSFSPSPRASYPADNASPPPGQTLFFPFLQFGLSSSSLLPFFWHLPISTNPIFVSQLHLTLPASYTPCFIFNLF